jgi:hypothetical protein
MGTISRMATIPQLATIPSIQPKQVQLHNSTSPQRRHLITNLIREPGVMKPVRDIILVFILPHLSCSPSLFVIAHLRNIDPRMGQSDGRSPFPQIGWEDKLLV